MGRTKKIKFINPGLTLDWLIANSTGKGVQVAVIDSGIDAAHPMLQGKIKKNCVVSKTKDGKIECIEQPVEKSVDSYGHGTAVAGIITDLAPDVELINVRVLNEYNACTGDVLIEGIKWALDQKIKLINMSLATSKPNWIPMIFKLCEQAYVQNSIIVASKRNMGDLGCPAMFSSVISVDIGDYNNKYQIHYRPDAMIEYDACGVAINVLAPGGGHAIQTGTSFATPHVCGMAALLLQAFPAILSVEVKAALKSLASVS